MKWPKRLKLLFVYIGSLLAISGLLVLFLTAKDILIALPYRHSFRDPVSIELIETCLKQKSVPTLSTDHSLAESLFSDATVVNWATTALPNILRFNYFNLQYQLKSSAKYFTSAGWCSFIDALAASNLLNVTINNKLELNMLINGTPKITNAIIRDGVYVWVVEVPVSLKFSALDAHSIVPPDMNNEKLLVQISRSSEAINPDRIGISRFSVVSVQ